MALPDLLSNCRAHLIEFEVVRDPRVAGALPPCWLEPRDGAPAPGEKTGTEDDDTATVSIFRTGGITPAFLEQRYVRKDTIDVLLRTSTPPVATEIEEQLREALLEVPGEIAETPAMAWQMNDLYVIQSQLWRPLQPLAFDENGYSAICSFLFELYVS